MKYKLKNYYIMKFLFKLKTVPFLILILIFVNNVFAYDFHVDGIYYNIIPNKNGEVAVTYKDNNYGSYTTNEVVIPSNIIHNNTKYNVTEIGKYAFLLCDDINTIILPNTIVKIREQAFSGCSSLMNIVIPESVTIIEDWAFYNCSSFYEIVIPNSVVSIGGNAFANCKKLTTVQLPIHLTVIAGWTFDSCHSLESIKLPENISEIGEYAFGGNKSLKGIKLPNKLQTIGGWAFQNCNSLTGIYLTEDITTIGYSAFNGCDSLTSIFFNPKNAKFLDDYAFNCGYGDSSKLETIVFGKYVESISTTTFGQLSIDRIITLNSTPPTCVQNAFENIDKTKPLFVPKDCYPAYWSAPIWSEFQNIIEIEKNIDSISLPKSVDILLGSTFQFSPTLTPQDPTLKELFWESSNPSIACVDQKGCVKALSNGSATITAKAIDGSDVECSCIVNIGVKKVDSIQLSSTEIILKKNDTMNISCIISPADASNIRTIWKSEDANIAVVRENNDGTATILGVKEGNCIITATTTDGSNLSASCKVTVVATQAELITLDKSEISLEVTQTAELTATVLPEYTTDKTVFWLSSNDAVATVDANGVVTAVAIGETTITATTADGSNLSATCKVTVEPTLAESITLNQTEISLEATETATLVATILPELTTDKSVIWKSSNEAVATVDEYGVVTAVALGEAIITATTIDSSNLSATCKVTVMPTLAESITLDKTEISLEATQTATLVATILPELATNKAATWTSSDKAVASVDENGLVTAIAVGEAIITATTNDGSNLSASCKVTVIPTLVTSIEVTPTEYEGVEGSEFQLTAIILPEEATNKVVIWSSSDEAFANVSEGGLVKVLKEGNTVITASTTDGSNLTATCKITVLTSIDGVSDDNIIVVTSGDYIIVSNAPKNVDINVYSNNGTLIRSVKSVGETISVNILSKGIYYVKVGNKTVKVII